MHPRSAFVLTAAVATAGFAWSPARLAWGFPQEGSPPAATPVFAPVPLGSTPALEKASRERLARALGYFSGRSIRKDEPSLADLELGILLAQSATESNPEEVWAWRALLNASSLGDPTDPQIDVLRQEAIERIAKLDPADEVIRFRRLLDVLDREPTADARIAKLETLLQPAYRDTIGNAVAARLAFDLALLQRRAGDMEAFERWLAEAATLDPAFPDAQAMAAGYFRFKTDDVVKQAELLVAAMMANPLDPFASRGFATMLLDHGAYAGAARFLGLTAESAATNLPAAAYDLLLADQVIALWAAGRGEEGAEIGRRRSIVLAEHSRNQLAKQDPLILGDRKRFEAVRYPVPSPLLAARAAILHAQGDRAATAPALDDLFYSLDDEYLEASRALDEATTEEEKAALRDTQVAALLQGAFVAYWLEGDAMLTGYALDLADRAVTLGSDAPERERYSEAARDWAERADGWKAERWLQRAEAVAALSDEGRQRFQAWQALRSQDPSSAVPLFEALTDDIQPVRIGRGLAYQAAGRLREAAQEFLAGSRLGPGTLLGVDCRRRLGQLLGQTPPLEPDALALQAVADGVPKEYDRLFAPDGRAVGFRIRPGSQAETIFDSIPVTLEVRNQSPLPLAISPDGPIRDLVILQAGLSAAGFRASIDVPEMVQSISRSFSVPPRGTLQVPVDLAFMDLGFQTWAFPASGCSFSLRGLLNWDTRSGGFRPGALGDTADSGVMRIDGVPMSGRTFDDWIRSTFTSLQGGLTPANIVDVVAMAHVTARIAREKVDFGAERRRALDQVWPLLTAALPAVDRWTQAWLLCVLPDNQPELEPVLDTVRGSPDKLVRLAYLIRRASQSTDPMLDAAIRSDDREISRYGRVVKEMLLHEEELTRRDYNLGTSGAQQFQKPQGEEGQDGEPKAEEGPAAEPAPEGSPPPAAKP